MTDGLSNCSHGEKQLTGRNLFSYFICKYGDCFCKKTFKIFSISYFLYSTSKILVTFIREIVHSSNLQLKKLCSAKKHLLFYSTTLPKKSKTSKKSKYHWVIVHFGPSVRSPENRTLKVVHETPILNRPRLSWTNLKSNTEHHSFTTHVCALSVELQWLMFLQPTL